MTEYIEREKALNALSAGQGCGVICYRAISRIPAADFAPVRHGRWLTWEEQFPGKLPKKKNSLGVFCDQCNKHSDSMTDYCPNCGAKMDGGYGDGKD